MSTGVTAQAPAGTDPRDDGGRHLLEVRDLSVWFDTPRGHVRAVDGIDLTLGAGETLAVVGESGSGKSVLARAIMRILARNAHVLAGSSIEFDGVDLMTVDPKKHKHLWGVDIAMVFQDPMTSLTPVMTIGRQLTETLRHHDKGMSKAAARAEAVRLLRLVGIPEPEKRFGQYPHNLSGGMRQRVIIALAISNSPRLLIADEPTTALDVTVQQQILNLLQDLRERTGMAMIMITHDLGVALGRADSIAVVYAGRVVEQAPTRRLFAHMRHPYTRALIDAIPRMSSTGHERLPSIPGRPPVIVDPPAGCRFAPRCPSAQQRCLEETPVLVGAPDADDHLSACFFPLGTAEGDEARRRNIEAGCTAAGAPVSPAVTI